MTFGEKLKKFRTDKGLTQEELAAQLYVSRTAISKWESDRGYPNIESLKAIAQVFSVTVDELLSSDEVLTIAEENERRTATKLCDLVFGLVDVCMALLLFLPLFATKTDGTIQAASLITLGAIPLYLRIAYLGAVSGAVIIGILELALQGYAACLWTKAKAKISLALGAVAVLLFVISGQPYAAVFCFSLLIIKAIMLIRRA